MSYKSYDKIELDTNKWSPDYKKIKSWAVCEKIHGANFSFIWSKDTNTIQYAKRSGIIQSNDSFFGYSSILPSTEPKIRNIINLVLNNNQNVNKIIIFGELFGGIYPVGEKCGFTPIQKGIYYSPSIHFIAFDIYVNDAYLDFEKSIDYFKQVNLMYTEPLEIFNKYEKACNYKLGFNTVIPKKLGLTELPINKAEGIIIRSMTNRFIVKRKIPEFCESEYSNNSVNINDKKTIGLKMITENRLNSAISKIGPLEDYKYEIYELMCQDILQELNLDNKSELKKVFLHHIKQRFL